MRRANAATDPIQAKAAWEKKCKTTAKLQQYTYGCKLLTPLFAGGVQTGQVDPFMPIRVPGIRGQLRFWWRIACADPHAPSAETFCRERDLWGGIGNSEPSASQIRIRVLAKPVNPSELISADATLGGVEKYAYGPGIIDGATALRAGYGFQLELSCPDAIADDVQTALRWWASFGGIGARTRRGLGAVQVEGIEPIDEQAVARRGGLLKCRREPFDAPQDAWTCAVTMLHQFRQGRGTGRNAQSTNDPKRPGRSFWPEPDQLRRFTGKNDLRNHLPVHPVTDVFPRAAFGMPILFDFRKKTKPDTLELVPDVLDGENKPAKRMASPLILRPYSDGEGWCSAALLLPAWRDALTTPLRFSQGLYNPLPWPSDQATQQHLASQIDPMAGLGDDPLTAFMAFFTK